MDELTLHGPLRPTIHTQTHNSISRINGLQQEDPACSAKNRCFVMVHLPFVVLEEAWRLVTIIDTHYVFLIHSMSSVVVHSWHRLPINMNQHCIIFMEDDVHVHVLDT